MSTPTNTGNSAITLPDATTAPWYVAPNGTTPGKSKLLTLYHKAGSGGTCTVTAQVVGGNPQKIYRTSTGVTSTTIEVSTTLRLRSDGTNWFVV